MKIDLLEILCDPQTKEPLLLKGAVYREKEIKSGFLVSPSGRSFPIIEGIPRFIKTNNYAFSFGLQWNRFARTQLDSITGRNYSRDRFRKEVAWGKEWARGKWIMDMGCGAGRFAEIAAESDCRLVAVDMSNAVDAAKSNLSRFSNVDFVQADLFNLPFRPGLFQGVYCIGVLQHTPDPYRAMRFLLDMLSPEGRFAFTIYARRPWTKLYMKYWLRKITQNIDDRKLLRLIEKTMPIAFAVTDILFRIPALGRVMRFLIPVANYVERDDLTREQRYEEAILDTFDMFSPRYDLPVTAPEVIASLKASGIRDFQLFSSCPVNVTGKKS